MINMRDALELIEERRGDAAVVPTMTGTQGWTALTRNEGMDLPLNGGMGKASSIALGVALARPDKRVIVIDGDGSLLMNLGSLVSIAGKAPSNLYHFVMDNGVYAVTGGQPVPNAKGYTFAGMAKAAGYAAAYEFDNLEDFATSVDEIFEARGPVLVALNVEPEIQTLPIGQRPRTRRTPQAIKDFHKALNG
ncbi:MAG: thiamine pyrophosphate-dependent enzyme [Chloroflexi bacterium]|nr:thiamine pyrophosphate-dependent enzyme [Chloroflexota bacterium]